jgi:hypothetical protein
MQPIDTIAVRAVNAQVTMCGWSRIVLAVHHRRRRYQRKERLAPSPSSARSPRLALWAGVARCGGAQFPTLAAVFEMLVTQRTSPHIPTAFVKSNTTSILASG